MDLSFTDLMNIAFEKADERLQRTTDSQARREFALAKTALEDAQMRFTRGVAMIQGKFAPADLEKSDA